MRVALTFDTEHPGRPAVSGVEDRILDVLAAAGLRATFFLQGRWVRAYPERARRIASEGHLVGNHSHHHAPMDSFTDEGLRRDVRSAEEEIRAATGLDAKPWFRCPFGAGMDDSRVLGLLTELGYRHVGWDVDPEDWNERRSADDVVTTVLGRIGSLGDAIVLLHGWPTATGDALPRIVEGLAEARAEVVDVAELLGQETVARNAYARASSRGRPVHE